MRTSLLATMSRPQPAALTFINYSGTATTSGSVIGTPPTGAASGDLLVACMFNNVTGVWSTHAAWTLGSSTTGSVTSGSIQYQVYDGVTANWTFTGAGGSCRRNVGIAAFRNASVADPLGTINEAYGTGQDVSTAGAVADAACRMTLIGGGTAGGSAPSGDGVITPSDGTAFQWAGTSGDHRIWGRRRADTQGTFPAVATVRNTNTSGRKSWIVSVGINGN